MHIGIYNNAAMTKQKLMKEFQPGHGFTKEDWDDVSDNPEWTAEDYANARPFREVFPDLAASIDAKRKAGRPKATAPKQTIALRVAPDVLAAFKATGPGWQTRMQEALRDWVTRNGT